MSSTIELDPTRALFESCTDSKAPTHLFNEPTRLFNENGRPNLAAAKCIFEATQSVRTTNPQKPSSYLFSHLPDNKCLAQFFKAIQALPESEKQFLLLPISSQFQHLNSLLSKIGLNGFYRCKEGEVVPSFGMMQTLLKVKYAAAPKLDPTYLTKQSKNPACLAMLARLQLGYAMLIATTTEPDVSIKHLLATVRITDEMRKELLEAQRQMPNDPLLKLLLQHTPSSKL